MSIRLVSNKKIAETSSKGNQEKWYEASTDSWYKLDQFGYEALAETVTSQILEQSNIESDTPFTFVRYEMEKIRAHGRERTGCSSKNFSEGYSIITVNHLLGRHLGNSLKDKLESLTSDKKRIEYLAEKTKEVTGLEYFPQYACENADGVVGEFCLGNEEGKTFIKSVLDEVMELFPDSRYIHIGGDEAETRSWDKCPRCRRAMQEANCSTMRQLENKFMIEMSRHVVAAGRIPVQWGTCSDQRYPVDTVIQTWLDIREPLRVAANGNKVIYSVHTSLYFDYPAKLSEPFETWMFELSERGVYMTDPYIIWPDAVKDAILGTEACLWTEQVPQWRVIRKILPRLAAYSECAWSLPENKDYHNFAQRREYLESAGWVDYLYRS